MCVGWIVWAQVDQNSAANRDIRNAINSARGAVEKASTDPSLKRAEIYFNDQFARTGAYPNLTDDQQHDNASTDFGVGVTVKWCNYQAVVLQSLTGSGSLSRLLMNGQSIGDVLGEHDCPASLQDPAPWKLPSP